MNADASPSPHAIDLNATLAHLRKAQQARTPDYRQRMDELARLRSAFKAKLEAFAGAMSADFGRRSRHESLLTDGMTVLKDIDHIRAHLRSWMKPEKRRADWLFWPARAELRYQPLGVIGVISPWNYPVNLALMPLAVAIAAGNAVMLKPSEHTPRTSLLLQELLASVFDNTRVATILGGADVAAAFAALPVDHLFFTGSTAVGRMVMAAAAPTLTPVTLELGGKSPTLIADGYPVELAAQRIAAAKFINAGQTCIAPDYVLMPKARIPALLDALRAYVGQHYPALATTPDFSSIANERQHQRLVGYLDDASKRGAEIIPLAQGDASQRVLAPTVVLNAPDDSLVMQEEIFGPILPVVACESIDAALAYVGERPRPLSFYLFDNDKARTERVLNQVVAGSVGINDAVWQFAQQDLPFGGVGASGMGAYHGHQGFLTFSKAMPVFYQSRYSGMAFMRPPYGKLAEFIVKFVTR